MELFIPEEIKEISFVLNNSGFQCFLVGGAIRNQLLGKEAKDYDLTTNAKPNDVIRLFKKVIPTGLKHGTVTILAGGHSFEITTYRIDGKYSDGRRPDKIQFTPSIEEDLLRRDFTINSLAYNIEKGEILDINNGIEDLNNSIIRAIGTPSKRFDEDALRLVRACRFASQLNFNIEESTYLAMSKNLGKLPHVSKERISDELLKILNSSHPSIAFNHFYNCGMLEILFPGIYKSAKSNLLEFKKSLLDIDTIKTDKPYIKFARILSIIPEKSYTTTLKNLKISNDFIKGTLLILKYINLDIKTLSNSYEVRKFISTVGVENIDDILTVWNGMENINKTHMTIVNNMINIEIKKKNPFSIGDLAISGSDLINEISIKPSPLLGDILIALLKEVLLNPKLNNRNTLLKNAKRLIEVIHNQ